MSFWDQAKARHGESVRISDTKRIFQDGTEITGVNYPVIHEVPSDKIGKLRAIRRYLAAKLDQEEIEFTHFKNDCVEQAHWNEKNPSACPPPHPESVRMLEAGKARIETLRNQIQEIDDQLPDEQVSRAEEDAESQRQAERRSLRDEISSVNY